MAVSLVPVVLVVRRRVASSSLGLVAREHPVVPVAHLVVHPCCSAVPAVPAVREPPVVRVSPDRVVPVVRVVRLQGSSSSSEAVNPDLAVRVSPDLVVLAVQVSPDLVVLAVQVSPDRAASLAMDRVRSCNPRTTTS